MANKHALLSASFFERWLNCPLSARLCKSYEDKGSNYGAEGTEAHRLCEFRLKQDLGLPAENPIEHFSWYNGEMDECSTHVGGSKMPANFNTITSEWKVSANKYRAPGGRAFCRPIRVCERTEIFENSRLILKHIVTRILLKRECTAMWSLPCLKSCYFPTAPTVNEFACHGIWSIRPGSILIQTPRDASRYPFTAGF